MNQIPDQINRYLKMREERKGILRKIAALQGELSDLEYEMGETRSEMSEANRTIITVWDGVE